MSAWIYSAFFAIVAVLVALLVLNNYLEKKDIKNEKLHRKQQKEQWDRVQRLIESKEYERANQQIHAKQDKKGNYYVLDQDGNWLKQNKNGSWSKVRIEDK